MVNLPVQLRNNAYPGRGIVLGRSADGSRAVIAYFIMGRSVNSRNRVFVEDGGGIRTKAFDPSKLSDPSLVIYAPVRVCGDITVVTNGDQTDTVADLLNDTYPDGVRFTEDAGTDGATFEDCATIFAKALRTRTFEPDGPNYTPRISGMTCVKNGSYAYALSILKSDEGDPDHAERFFYEYEAPKAGKGHFIHTYDGDGDPLPGFTGEPEVIDLTALTEGNDLKAFTDSLWQALNEENKVSLFTRFIDLVSGEAESMIVNRNTD